MMTFKAYRYTTLLTSLPHLPAPFQHQRLPISRVRLEQRLGLLTEEDRGWIERLERLVVPYRLGQFGDDVALLRESQRLLARLDASGRPHRWLEWWMTLNGMTAALRLRQRGGIAPGTLAELPAVGRQLIRQWSHPLFRLENRLPWLETLATQVGRERAEVLEHALIDIAWAYFSRQRAEHPYGLEDVMLYLYRWWLLERAMPRNAGEARERFTQWVDAIPAQSTDFVPWTRES
nr:hypothetical protein [Halomonas elongata]